jgi:hypothetical protein
VYRLLVGKPERKRQLGRPRRRWMDNIKTDLLEIGWGCVDWIGLVQDRYRWRALESSVMNDGGKPRHLSPVSGVTKQLKWKSFRDRMSVGQSVSVSGPHLGPKARFEMSLSCKQCFSILHKDSVRTSQETHHVFATEPSRLMLCGETVAVCCENRTEHTDTVRTSQETHHVSTTQPNRLMLCGETVAVCCENRTEHTDTVRTSQETQIHCGTFQS